MINVTKIIFINNIRSGALMFKLFRKSYLSLMLALVSLSTLSSSLIAQDCCDPCALNRIYVGGFGGMLYSNSTKVYQMGTAFFEEASGGPLAVDARGKTKSASGGFGGAQIGYEWTQCPLGIGCSDWTLVPALEVEAYWYSHHKKGHLLNRTDTDRLPEHDFLDSFHMNNTVLLANTVLSLNHSCFGPFSPYVGGGIGAVHISLTNADSLQVAPPEPGINHFNSKRDDTTWAFAAQVKAGVRYNFCEAFHIFGEYRYLFVDSSNYILGSTVYPTHAHTSPWNVKVKNIQYNAFAFGIQYDL